MSAVRSSRIRTIYNQITTPFGAHNGRSGSRRAIGAQTKSHGRLPRRRGARAGRAANGDRLAQSRAGSFFMRESSEGVTAGRQADTRFQCVIAELVPELSRHGLFFVTV